MSPHAHYDGTSKYKVWEAVRASTSAPGYFEEYLLDGNVFQVTQIFIYLDKKPTYFCFYRMAD
jgi:predicted acylesterase/phospholipase RssA